jgi:hypothetical protein
VNPIVFYVGAGCLCVLGVLCIYNTAPYSSEGGGAYERIRARRVLGLILLIAAVLLLWLAVSSQFFSTNGPEVSVPLTNSTGERQMATVPFPPRQASQPSSNGPANYPPMSSDAGPPEVAMVTPPPQVSQPSSTVPAINYPPMSSDTDLPQVATETPPPAQVSRPSSSAPASVGPGLPQVATATPPPAKVSQPSSSAPAINSPPPSAPVTPPPSPAAQPSDQKQFEAKLDKANAAVQAAPQNPDGYALRGNIYAEEKLWDQAAKDYQTVLQLDGKNMQMKFNLAELQFMQKKYDDARSGFAALEQDPNIGDLATYKVFLCDLFGGHDEAAAKELDAFNQIGENASYYFANASWSLYHQKTEDARGWLLSAQRIYPAIKFRLYATSLVNLGYLPLPPPQQ